MNAIAQINTAWIFPCVGMRVPVRHKLSDTFAAACLTKENKNRKVYQMRNLNHNQSKSVSNKCHKTIIKKKITLKMLVCSADHTNPSRHAQEMHALEVMETD